MSHYTVGGPGGQLTYALDLDKIFAAMESEARTLLIARAAQARRSILTELEADIRAGLSEAAESDGDPVPVFERRGEVLFITAAPEVAPSRCK